MDVFIWWRFILFATIVVVTIIFMAWKWGSYR